MNYVYVALYLNIALLTRAGVLILHDISSGSQKAFDIGLPVDGCRVCAWSADE